FQAEDGIRAFHVTGVQTCALPISEALIVTPSFIDQSLAAARVVAAQAIGDPNARTGGTVYNVTGGDQETHVEGLPLGTRGGMAVDRKSRRVGKECSTRWSAEDREV